MWDQAMWLGIPEAEFDRWNVPRGNPSGYFAYYRCTLEVPDKDGQLSIHISANSRYRLWVNGRAVLSGPCKGNRFRYYYETVDVSEALVCGKNVLAVQVLYTNPDVAVKQTDAQAGIYSVVTPAGGHRLAVEGTLKNAAGTQLGTVTTGIADWRVYLEGSASLKSTKITEYLGAVCESFDFRCMPQGWKLAAFDASAWRRPVALETVALDDFMKHVGLVQRFPMKAREIPLLYEQPCTFERELSTGQIPPTGILETGRLVVPAGTKGELLLDAGVHVNGYPVFCFSGGRGSRVTITYMEKFVHHDVNALKTEPGDGPMEGLTDEVITGGGDLEIYEPFWYRTFRFIYLRFETVDEPLIVERPSFIKTGYPLEVKTKLSSSAPWVSEVYEMCLRTLKNCMMETYMDCPYYEQLQFSMDTRLQALFTYRVSDDVRLAAKALKDFHDSMIPEGLIQGKYPSAYPQIISTFSLHYIYMLKEYYEQTGDASVLREYLPDIDRILGYYDRKIGEDGLVGRLGYWEFVDWQPEWDKTGGIPEALLYGPSTIINLMYACALKDGAYVCAAVGRNGMAQEYLDRQKQILDNVQALCWDTERGLYREGPNFAQFTRHAQSWAVLNEMLPAEASRQLLKTAMAGEDVLKCTFSTSYEWFRALEAAGLYGLSEVDMADWIRLPALGSTTCPETPVNSRSECHAWSALPLYELVSAMAGIRPDRPGWETVRIAPDMAYLPDLSGEAATPRGILRFDYGRQDDGTWRYQVELPPGLSGIFVTKDGRRLALEEGKNSIAGSQEGDQKYAAI